MNDVKCKKCGWIYHFPSVKFGDAEEEEESVKEMDVVSEPFVYQGKVWFWSKKGESLYLNRSCKDKLDLVFLCTNQCITSRGKMCRKDVRLKWTCQACGEEQSIEAVIPCLIHTDTKIKLQKLS